MMPEDQERYDKGVVAAQEAAAHMIECIGDAVRGVGATLAIYIALQALDVFIKL